MKKLFSLLLLLLSTSCVVHTAYRDTLHTRRIQTTAFTFSSQERLTEHVRRRAEIIGCEEGFEVTSIQEDFIYWTCFN